MFLVTSACADIMNVSRGKMSLKLTLSLNCFLFYVAGIEEYKSDSFCITDCEMFYGMVALHAGRVSNCFRDYANFVHFLTQLK